MSAPTYVWSCKRCHRANEPNTDTCSWCGCPASIAPVDLDPPKKGGDPKHFFEEPGSWLIFLPELPIAALLAVASPVWAVSLMLHGHIVGGIILMLGVVPLCYGAYWGIRSNNRWGTYMAIFGILVLGMVISSNT